MLKLFAFLISIFLILIIFLRLPKDAIGLAGLKVQGGLLGSPGSTERALNILTGLGIFLYFMTASLLNLRQN